MKCILAGALLLTGAVSPGWCTDYTQEQMKFAGEFGAAYAAITACGRFKMTTESMQKALERQGLSATDIIESTDFKERMMQQAQATTSGIKVGRDLGLSEGQVTENACDDINEMWGPEGRMIPGLAVPTD